MLLKHKHWLVFFLLLLFWCIHIKVFSCVRACWTRNRKWTNQQQHSASCKRTGVCVKQRWVYCKFYILLSRMGFDLFFLFLHSSSHYACFSAIHWGKKELEHVRVCYGIENVCIRMRKRTNRIIAFENEKFFFTLRAKKKWKMLDVENMLKKTFYF